MILDPDRCYLAVSSRDQRFDGFFLTAVHTTGIYCRPSCPATTPKRENVSFFPTAAAAQRNGFRACKRCRPDATPGSPEWNVRADVVARTVRLIADGVVDREGVGGLASRLGYSSRQLNRLVNDELGAGPLALARSQRAQTARVLIETTDMPFTDVAFAAGFASVRQFNDTVQEVYASSPSALRLRRGHGLVAPETVTLKLAYRAPYDAEHIFGFLALRAIPGVEHWDGATYTRSLDLPRGHGVVRLAAATGSIRCELRLDDWRDLQAAVQRCRRLLDLDADTTAIDTHLGQDALLRPLVAARPGLRSPGHVDGPELAVRAVLGQQVSVAGARTHAARLVEALGAPLRSPLGAVTHVFPTSASLAAMDPDQLRLPMARKRSLLSLCAALADGSVVIDVGADRQELHARLVSLPGIGPWTAAYVALRALGDPDVFLPTDLGVKHALNRLGADGSPRGAYLAAQGWQPWRSYALHHLWATL